MLIRIVDRWLTVYIFPEVGIIIIIVGGSAIFYHSKCDLQCDLSCGHMYADLLSDTCQLCMTTWDWWMAEFSMLHFHSFSPSLLPSFAKHHLPSVQLRWEVWRSAVSSQSQSPSNGFSVYLLTARIHEGMEEMGYTCTYRLAPKMAQFFWCALTSSNINRFSKLFHYQNQEKTCNNTITKDPTTPQVCCYTTLWNVKCLKNNNWKRDDFCNNTFLRN